MKPILYNFTEDDHTYLILDLRTLDIKYMDIKYVNKVETTMQEKLNLSNLQMCVVLDSLHNYKDR